MRELKFRAWYKTYNEMCEVASLWFNYGGTLRVVVIIENMFNDRKVVNADDVIVEQHTGLKDKNGKEIYEGDIVSKHNSDLKGVVKQVEDGQWAIYWDNVPDGYYVLFKYSNLCEVVGNIHENPELLERKK